jgi:hypothetical protein
MHLSKLISGAIYFGSLAVLAAHLDSKQLFGAVVILAAPVAMVWYPEEINSFTLGSFGEGGSIDKATPGWMISGFGWICLVGLVAFFVIRYVT